MKRLLYSFLLLALPLVAVAEQVKNDGLWYEVIEKAQKAEVIKYQDGIKYSGNIVIPDKVTHNGVEYSVTSIGNEAFSACSSLTDITIPNSVTSIGIRTFRRCSSLTNITIPNSVTSIGNEAFSSCSSLTDITIPNSVTYIGEYAFSYCSSLTDITIPNSVTSIGDWAFSDCSSLTDITIPNSVTYIGEYAFSYCSSLTNITIPNSVTSIRSGAFEGCSSLTNITIPNSVTIIEWRAFKGCSSLTNITIPNSVTSIEIYTFEGCSSLTNITIPNSVTSIGDEAFSGCKNLTDVYCNAKEVPSTKSDAFKGSYIEYITLHVPDSSYYDYKEAAVWKDFGTITTLSGNIPAFTHNLIYMLDGVEYKTVAMDYKTGITLDAAPAKEGHSFSGWSEVPATMPLHDVVVTGSFTPNKYYLTYKVDGKQYKRIQVVYGDSIIAEAAPTKEGYTFSGWSEIPATMPAKAVTIEGTFDVNYYQLTYLVDSIEYATDSIAYNQQIDIKEAPIKEGHSFSGWSEVPSRMPANDVVVTGSFTPNKYYLTYKVDGKQYKRIQVVYGDSIIAEAAPTKEGHTFSGWSEIPETMPAKAVTIEGTFDVNYYQLTYLVDGEIFQIDSLAYGSSIVNPEAPVKEDYEFNGWSETPRTMPARDLTVTGSYTLLIYCDTPTISYKDGKLTFECTTEGAECVTNITSDDFAEHVGREMSLTLTYQVNVYAKADGYAKSPVATATICWIECDHKSDAHDVEAIPATVVLIKTDNGIVTIEGLEEGTPVAVYTTTGVEMVNGVAEEDAALTLDTRMQRGDIAIVKMGTKSVKVIMK